MKFIPIRELRNKSGQVWKSLETEGELVLTSNGKPVALITPVDGENLEYELKIIRRSRAALALDRIRRAAQEKGLDRISPEEVDRVIDQIRRKKKNSPH